MTPYADSDLVLIVRYVPVERLADFIAAGWIERWSNKMDHRGWRVLVEWPLNKGDPVEPREERVDV
jgi:hypothetical protein